MKVSLRDLLLAFAIFGLALGWGLDHFRLATGDHHRGIGISAAQ